LLILNQFIIKIEDIKLSYWKTEPIYDNITKMDMYLFGTTGPIGKLLHRGPKNRGCNNEHNGTLNVH
jgi:hypothetical protein